MKVPRPAIRWTHTFGLGGSSLVLWCALAFTGMLMLLVYQPVPLVAHDSVATLEGEVGFGPLVRGVHYWGANLLIIVVLLHIGRVLFTGGFRRPRRLNWIVGATLLVGVLASAFTGYLLPWDQRAFWAITISTGMLTYVPFVGEGLQQVVRGGSEIGAGTLLTFYTYHTTILPVLAVGLMAFHFWRVRKADGVIAPLPAAKDRPGDAAGEDRTLFFPDLLVREISQTLAVLAVVIVLGAALGAPMGEPANPGMSPNPAKAPWYFMGFQEMLVHLHPIFAVLLFPAAAIAGFVALPWLGGDDGTDGRWFLSSPGARAAGLAAVAGVTLTLAAVLLDDAIVGAASGGAGWFARGVLPMLLLAGATAALVAGARARLGLGRNESLQTAVVFLFATFATLTAIGIWLRGENMALTLPWGG